MLENSKQQVYEANMELPRRGLLPTHGAMCRASTGNAAFRHQAVRCRV